MKRTFFIVLILMLVSFFAGIALAAEYAKEEVQPAANEAAVQVDEIKYDNSPVNKLGRGAINTTTCWLEIPAKIYDVSNKRDPVLGWTLGLAEGTLTTFVRAGTGLFDVVTFVIPPYNKPIMTPEYAFQNANDKMKEYTW